jgi:hypothetical protein
MNKSLTFLFALLFSTYSFSQTVQYGIFNEGTDLIVKAKPSGGDINSSSFLVDAVFTIRWNKDYSIDLNPSSSNYYIQKAGEEEINGIYEYQIFAFTGNPLQFPEVWLSGNEYEILRVGVAQTGQGTGVFELGDKNFLPLYQGEPYMEVDGESKIDESQPFYQQSTGNVPLPVELSSFAAELSGNAVLLEWTTLTEINNYGFNIERNDGSNWEVIGFVEGVGNSNSVKNYNFSDISIKPATDYLYRLKQIDSDGSFKYYEEVEVTTLPAGFSLHQNYPNPFNPTTSINYSLAGQSEVKLAIYNALGEEIKVIEETVKEAGTHQVNWNASANASGVYYLSLSAKDLERNDKNRSIIKMILLK